MKFKKFFSVLLVVLTVFMLSSGFSYCFAGKIDDDAEILYMQIKRFLNVYNKVDSEYLDNVCQGFMNDRIPRTNLLNKQDFEEKSKGNIILYRGVSDKEYADRFKQGEIFLSRWNIRGSGVYTTTSLDCAKCYASDKKIEETLIKIFIPKDGIKILNSKYLEELKEIIIKKHGEEFVELKNKKGKIKENDHIYDELNEYIDTISAGLHKQLKEYRLMLSEEEALKKAENLISENIKNLEEDPKVQKLRSERKRYYKSNVAYVWFNSGLLAKLMGYDVLYTYGSLRELFSGNEEEYLVVNPNVLNVLQD